MSRAFVYLLAMAAFVCAADAPLPPQSPSTRTNQIPKPLLFPLPSRSPVEAFRELLAMPRAERTQYLSTRSPESRDAILKKLRQYESLRPDERELRLKVTELRWYLLPLMHSPSTNRTAQLGRIPEGQRELVASRLREWDALEPAVREELLQNEATLQYFTEVDSGTQQPISEARRKKLEEGISQWQALPEDRRRRIVLQFNKFFDLTPQEKERALTTVSDAERRQIEKALEKFGKLPEQQREQCIRSFQKFASLSIEERQEFLKNAERWKLMQPEERQSWRELVSRLSSQPPLPQGLARQSLAAQIRRRIKMAPLPPGLTNTASRPPVPQSSAVSSQPRPDERPIIAPTSSPNANEKPLNE